jgi:flagellar FliL protein
MIRLLIVLFVLYLSPFCVAEEEAVPKVVYWELRPSFVANFGADGKKLRFVKVDVSVRLGSEQAIAKMEVHQALVRHQIVMLLSRQTEADLARPEAQELLRQEALALTQKVLEEETGSPLVEDLLFTNFVTQR